MECHLGAAANPVKSACDEIIDHRPDRERGNNSLLLELNGIPLENEADSPPVAAEETAPTVIEPATLIAPAAMPSAPVVAVAPAFDPRRRIRELMSIPDRDRTDEAWDELNELEIQTAPGNRIGNQPFAPYNPRAGSGAGSGGAANKNRNNKHKGPRKPGGGGGSGGSGGKPFLGKNNNNSNKPRPT